MRGTHWIDWDSEKEETINPWPDPMDEMPKWSSTATSQSGEVKPEVVYQHQAPTVDPPALIIAPEAHSALSHSVANIKASGIGTRVLGFALGASLSGAAFGLWKLVTGVRRNRQELEKDPEQPLADGKPRSLRARAWVHHGTTRTKQD